MKRLKAMLRGLCCGEKGFTLIELLVVIGILAVLAGVVTLGVTQFIGRGADEAWNTEKHNMQTAVAAWMADHPNGDPTTVTETDLITQAYLISTPRWDWTWDATGKVTDTDRGSTPEYTPPAGP